MDFARNSLRYLTQNERLADHCYGERGGRLRDPFGHQWMLSRVTEVLSAGEIARRGAALL